jgi:hypothetical protein
MSYLTERSIVPRAASLLGFPHCKNAIMYFIEFKVKARRETQILQSRTVATTPRYEPEA